MAAGLRTDIHAWLPRQYRIGASHAAAVLLARVDKYVNFREKSERPRILGWLWSGWQTRKPVTIEDKEKGFSEFLTDLYSTKTLKS